LTVPPSTFLIRFRSSSSERTQQKRRWEPIAVFSGTSGAGLASAHPTSLTASTDSVACSIAAPGCSIACSSRRASFSGAVATPSRPRTARSLAEGSGSGIHPCSGPAGSGTGVTSNSTVAMSTPDTPSTSAWWVFVSSANRFRCRPWTSQSSHSGFERSSCCENSRPVSLRSWSSDPGCGSAEWRTWYSRWKCGSSIQNGLPICSGGNASFWRNRGTRWRRERT
jgi:hypothetical protein